MFRLPFIFLCFCVNVNSVETGEESTLLSLVQSTEVEASGSSYNLDDDISSKQEGRLHNKTSLTYSQEDGSGFEGSGFHSNKTGRWWWFDDDEEEEEDADESTWTEWLVSGVVANTLELGAQVVVGAASGVGNYISDGLFGEDDETTTQRPATTEGSWLLGGFISNILSGGETTTDAPTTTTTEETYQTTTETSWLGGFMSGIFGKSDAFEGSGRSFGGFDFSGSGAGRSGGFDFSGSGEGRSALDIFITQGSGSSGDGSVDAYQSLHETQMAGVVTIDKLFQADDLIDAVVIGIGAQFIKNDCQNHFLIYTFNAAYFEGLEKIIGAENSALLYHLVDYIEDECETESNSYRVQLLPNNVTCSHKDNHVISQQCFKNNGVLGRSHFIYQDADAIMMLWNDNPNIAFLICSLGIFLLAITVIMPLVIYFRKHQREKRLERYEMVRARLQFTDY